MMLSREGTVLSRVLSRENMQDGFIGPDSDLASCQRGAEPDLLPADPQVSGRRHQPVGLDSDPRRLCVSNRRSAHRRWQCRRQVLERSGAQLQ